MTDNPTAVFWCPECRTEVPDVIRTSHLAAHFAEKTEVPWSAAIIVWAAAIAIGVVAGLLVAALFF